MKLLLDSCISNKAQKELQVARYDVIWVGEWPEDPGDEEILARAYKEGRILVTLDRDFGELAIVYRKPHAGIIRLVNTLARSQASVCLHVLRVYGDELAAGAIITADPGRLRVRTPSRFENGGSEG